MGIHSQSFFEGPTLPKKLALHATIRNGYDLIAIGGFTENPKISSKLFPPTFSGSLFKLKCWNHVCRWEMLTQELKVPRGSFSAIPVPDTFIECEE